MPSAHRTIHFVGSASGTAAGDTHCWEGPFVLKNSTYLAAALDNETIPFVWDVMLDTHSLTGPKLPIVAAHNEKLAQTVAAFVRDKQFFNVFGGDHSCAVGTWSGVHSVIKEQGDLGLIWIDAHMDAHTPETSETKNIHGMPVACLLGEGVSELTGILTPEQKIKPEHLCLIGVRSFEKGEADLLKRLNVRVFFMDEVKKRGLDAVMQEAINIVTHGTVAYGVSIDIDSIDPSEAPGTGAIAPNGLTVQELCQSLTLITNDKRLIGTEIVEFNPKRDKNHITEMLIANLLIALLTGVAVNKSVVF